AWNRLGGDGIALAAAKNRTDSGPPVRGKATAMDRITQCQCAKHRPDSALFVDIFTDKNAIERTQINVETALVRIEDKTFKTDAEVTMEKVFDIAAAAPGVIVSNVTVE